MLKRLLISFLIGITLLAGTFAEATPSRAALTWDENESLEWRLAGVANETEEIFASYLLFDGNKTGRLGLALMREAKRKGAKKVRLIVDGWPVNLFIDKFIDLPTIAALAAEGVEIRHYNYVNLKSPKTYTNLEFTKRSHDKLLFLRSQKVVHSGDANWQNVNFRRQNTKGLKGKSYLSIETVVQGDVTENVANHLEKIWALSKPLDFSNVTQEEIAQANRNMDRVLSVASKLPRNYPDWTEKAVEVDSVKFFSEHPDTKPKRFGEYSEIDLLQIDLLDQAKPGEKAIIMAPYVRLMPEYWKAVKNARTRNVEIIFIVPAKSANDVSIPTTAFEAEVPRLLEIGVEVREVGKGFAEGDFLHAKRWAVGNKSWITSHNLNPRSTYTDLESGFLIVGEAFAKLMKQHSDYIEKLSIQFNVPTGLKDRCIRIAVVGVLKIPAAGKQF